MNKPKVLMIGPGRNVRGGISTVVNNYYELGLDKDVDLYYLPTMEDGSKIKKLFIAGKAYIQFRSLLKRYDIVHVHMAAQASFDRKALFIERAHKAGKTIIIHQHAADFDKYFLEQSDDAKRKRIKEIFSFADKVIVLSEEWAVFFGQYVCDPEKIKVLYNGVILPEYCKKDYRDHNVLTLGRLGERKGTYDLLKAIPIILRSVPDVFFYFGGDGDEDQCRKIVAINKLENHVMFLGWVDSNAKEELFKKCSTFILPSYHEGMPMAVLEAMSYGLATISTNAGGIPQIIEQGKSGFRIKAGDIDLLSSVLIDVLQNGEKRETLGKNGRKRIAEKFDLLNNIRTIEQLYCSLAG